MSIRRCTRWRCNDQTATLTSSPLATSNSTPNQTAMKPTTYFLALGLATTGLAAPAPETLVAREDSNVLICKEVNCLGNDQVNIGVTINQCRTPPSPLRVPPLQLHL